MQVLNFVPEDYIQKKLVRQANFLCLFLALAVVLAVAVLIIVMGMAEDGVSEELDKVNARVARAGNDVEQWNQVEQKRKALLSESGKAVRLMEPLPRSRLLAEIVRALPEHTTLTSVEMDEQTVRLGRKPAPADAAQRRRKARTQAAAEPKFVEKLETRLKLSGLAPTDVQVAQLIAALSNSALFGQVELAYSEDWQIGSAGQDDPPRTLRQFEVHFKLSDDPYRLSKLLVDVSEGEADDELPLSEGDG